MINLGCSGWYYEHWAGTFYPSNLDRGDWLEYYSKKFKTVEINSTFYNFPTPKILKGWTKRTPDDFKLSLKVNRLISHEKRFEGTEELIERFYKLGDKLGDKLGCFLFQLPSDMNRNLKTLEAIIKQFDLEKNNVIEFRHESWWDPRVYALLKENDIAFCIESHPKLPEDIVVTSKNVYFRLHGRDKMYSSNYSKQDLQELARKIGKIKGKKEVWIYFNNDLDGYAPTNCLQLAKMLK